MIEFRFDELMRNLPVEIMGLLNLSTLFLVGLALGGLYFWGLWFTLRRVPRWRHPFLGMGLSLLTRLTLLLGLGGLLLRDPIAPPLQTVLLLSFGVWCSRNLLITILIATVKRDIGQIAPTQ